MPDELEKPIAYGLLKEAPRKLAGFTLSLKTACDPFFPVFLYIGCIWFCLYLSTVSAADPQNDLDLVENIFSAFGQFLGVPPKSNPFLAMLTGVNLVTVVYGLWYYTDERKLLGIWPAALAIGIAFILMLLAQQGNRIIFAFLKWFGIPEESPDHSKYVAICSVYKEFVVAFCVTTFFAVVDYRKSKVLPGVDERARLYFQSLYISTPTLIALLVAMFFHLTAEYIAHPQYFQSVAYLAGVTALIVVLSNVTFALFCTPRYAAKLSFELKE
ncbi:MAG: hypothetical protein AW12_00255 [Candidatus Accumulibacter sp. BA-94]|uniref:hypothetical protein n=1 Tax=Accumulibacter sp. TaxID=2053492 RepID=UPI00044A7FC2|nr:hypothetical protein [Accumulibacter sp.]EXI92775.1 MAG: hypothetical protein AW12_00255 [Candidatus Accumulibacter sp. BA-94]HRD86639.1 hypothetical protein [Accumulibacter sp.]